MCAIDDVCVCCGVCIRRMGWVFVGCLCGVCDLRVLWRLYTEDGLRLWRCSDCGDCYVVAFVCVVAFVYRGWVGRLWRLYAEDGLGVCGVFVPLCVFVCVCGACVPRMGCASSAMRRFSNAMPEAF